VISEDEMARIMDEIGLLALGAARIDLDGFLSVAELASSPQALLSGFDFAAVASAGEWAEMASLLRPFRDKAIGRLDIIRAHLANVDPELLVDHRRPGATWEERYLSLIPERLSAEDAQVLLDLLREDQERFVAALQEFIENSSEGR
jgi:hypothetical protein